MPILFYWKKKRFRAQIDNRTNRIYSPYKKLHELSKTNENLWILSMYEGEYILVGKFILKSKDVEHNANDGDFYVVADKNKSEYFEYENQNNAVREIIMHIPDINWYTDIWRHFHGSNHIRFFEDDSEIEKYAKSLKPLIPTFTR